MRVGLVADDVTGAGDASVQFAKRGWETFLSLEVRLKPDTTHVSVVSGFSRTTDVVSGSSRTLIDRTVLAVTTDARAVDTETAHALTRDALLQLMAAGIDRVFLKIDSTMRGSVPGQISGALAAWRTRHPDARAIVCPAYPRMGRTVQNNRLLVHGQPVEHTAIGRDPVTPVTTSLMSELIPASPSITLADAASDDDLTALASTIAAAGPSVMAVGSGGLAEALAERWSPVQSVRSLRLQPDREALHPVLLKRNPRILLLVTSLNPVSHSQVARLREACPDVVVVLAPDRRVDDSSSVAETLAREFASLVERERWDMVGLIGGDGARAALTRLGASGMRIVDSVLEGIPLGVIVGGSADGTPVFTKAGGFGAEDALVRVVERTRERRGAKGPPQASGSERVLGPRDK